MSDLPGKKQTDLSYTASLITQGRHRLFTLTMPTDVLTQTCTVDTRIDNPIDGFQRKLDRKRAEDIARYIDDGFGTIPCSIVLSAQAKSSFEYLRSTKTVSFKNVPGAFLILDGQHRVFGFSMAKSALRVPVVIYSGLSRADECRLFIDINTKQRPVPNELLLDIKRLAELDDEQGTFLRDLYDNFDEDPDSPLVGLLSPSTRAKGKISRVTFNSALKSIWTAFDTSDVGHAYKALSCYLHACRSGLTYHGAEAQLTNPTLFKALIFLFPDVAQRVADRHESEFTTDHFAEILTPFFHKVRKSDISKPGNSYFTLHENFKRALRQQFVI